MLEKEKIVKEQRTAEAIDKNLMGLEGKLGIILKHLGVSIVSQNVSNYNSTEWQDVYADLEDEQMPVYDPDSPIMEMGKIFDGLKFGYHLEISFMMEGAIPVKINEYKTIYEAASKVIKVTYKGYLVYLETESDLRIYKPMDEWEDIINTIYASAKKLQITHRKDSEIEEKAENKKNKLSFLERLRETWGI
jgi:hypothetical protein